MSLNEVEVAVPENLQNGEMDSVEETNGSMGQDDDINENDMGSKEVRVVKKAKDSIVRILGVQGRMWWRITEINRQSKCKNPW